MFDILVLIDVTGANFVILFCNEHKLLGHAYIFQRCKHINLFTFPCQAAQPGSLKAKALFHHLDWLPILVADVGCDGFDQVPHVAL